MNVVKQIMTNLVMIVLVFALACSNEKNIEENKTKEPAATCEIKDVDGNTYGTVKIGEQWWMAENLKVTRYRNGEVIANVEDKNSWADLNTGAYCINETDSTYSKNYGLLYNWYAVNDPRGLPPEGWHVPSDSEWQELVNFLGGLDVAGAKLKIKGTSYWQIPNSGATNESGFSALPGGYRNYNGQFSYISKLAYFWSSSSASLYDALYWSLGYGSPGIAKSDYPMRSGFSVRCVKD